MESPKNVIERSNGQHSNEFTDKENAELLPHLESLEKMLKLPVVEAAWQGSQDVYGRVKGKEMHELDFLQVSLSRFRCYVSDLAESNFVFDSESSISENS